MRFYIRKYDLWCVFMGDEIMNSNGSGLLVRECGSEQLAIDTVGEYTRVFNGIVKRSNG